MIIAATTKSPQLDGRVKDANLWVIPRLQKNGHVNHPPIPPSPQLYLCNKQNPLASALITCYCPLFSVPDSTLLQTGFWQGTAKVRNYLLTLRLSVGSAR